MKEIWKDIKGYEGYYQVSESGVKSLSRSIKNGRGVRPINERILKPHLNKRGYLSVNLNNMGAKTHHIHRLVSLSFIPNPDNKPCINHKNGIKTDFRIKNLEWCTHAENMKHSYSIGLHDCNRPVIKGKT